MASLERIRSELDQLSRQAGQLGIDGAKALLYEFVFELIQEDAGFYIVETDAGALCAAVGDEDEQLYLRAYTDWELASNRAMPIGGKTTKLHSLDFLRLCKWLFLQGVWGVVLNEEDAMAVLSIPELLHTFLSYVLRDETAYEESFVNCMRLISAVRHNATFKLVCALENGLPDIHAEGEEQGYIYSESHIVMPGASTELAPVNLQTLFHFHNTVKASLPFAEFAVSSRDLLAALKVCGITREDELYTPATTFYDEPIDATNPGCTFETITDLRLCFRPEDYEASVSESPRAATLVPVPEETEDDNVVCCLSHKIKIRIEGFITAVKHLFVRMRQHLSSLKREKNAPRETEKRNIRPIVAVAIIVCILTLGAIGALSRTARVHHQLNSFKEELAGHNYDEALELYDNYSDPSAADAIVTETIRILVEAYARNQIDADSLDSELSAMAVFPNQEAALMDAYAAAAQLDASKTAYAAGIAAENSIEKLKLWTRVIALDEVNYRKVQSEAALYREQWEELLLERVEDLAYIDRSEASACARAAIHYYSDNEEAREWLDLFAEEELHPADSYPILVRDLQLLHHADGSISIYLKWKNLTKSTIQSVCFYFRLLDAEGHSVTYLRRGEEIELFRGEESKAAPYEPGFEITSDTWGWTGIWKEKGDRVAEAMLTCVEVNFQEGTNSVFVTQKDLSGILG